MTTRRQALKALFAAPVAAKGAMDAAAQEVTSMGIGSVGYGNAIPSSDDCAPRGEQGQAVRDAVRRIQQAMNVERDASYEVHNRMPPHIATKKSWSPVFKHSEARKEALATERRRQMVESILYGNGFKGKARRTALKALGLGDLA